MTQATQLPASRPTLAVIVGSIREGRFGDTVARWFVERVNDHDEFDVDLIDLVDVPLSTTLSESPECDAYTARIEAADAFVMITPEYNHGYPASLKLAIDSVHGGWQAKPVGFVSYGGLAGGMRSVEQLRQVMPELYATTVRNTVSFHMAHGQFDGDGQPIDRDGVATAAKIMLTELGWWARALRTARAAEPFPS